jgi:hypothetical protein
LAGKEHNQHALEEDRGTNSYLPNSLAAHYLSIHAFTCMQKFITQNNHSVVSSSCYGFHNNIVWLAGIEQNQHAPEEEAHQ